MRIPVGMALLPFVLALSVPSVVAASSLGHGISPGERAIHPHSPVPVIWSIAPAPVAGGIKPVNGSHKQPHRRKKHHQAPSPVTIKVSAGFSGMIRASAWLPVRVTLHNRSAATISGTVEIPDTPANMGPPQPYRSLYQLPIVLPANATKQVTLYMPGSDVQGQVDVQVHDAGRVLGEGSDFPSTVGSGDLVAGALATDPTNTAWLRRINPPVGTLDIARLSNTTLDGLPDVLANFDVIVIADNASSALDHDQLSALERYVRAGGSLLLVGGPDWQETLRPLPSSLIPGTLSGTRTVPDLLGLRAIEKISAPRHHGVTAISVLTHPRGSVLASEQGVPLVVQDTIGLGRVVYLGFDPSVDPVPHWTAADPLLERLIGLAAPVSMSHTAQSHVMGPPPSPFMNQFGPPLDIGSELADVPAAALPSIVLFVVLTLIYVLLLGPVNFLVLRRFNRRELSWITIPSAALLCVGSTFGVAFHLKGNTVLVNTIGVVQLDGQTGPHPAALYVGLFAPVRGDYHLTYNGPALPSYIPQFQYYGGPGGQPATGPLGLRLQEGAQAQVQFLSMNMWSMRDVALHSWVNVPGTVHSQLHVDAKGNIVGAVHNDTSLTLIDPAIIAGRNVIHLRDMPPETTIPVRIKPGVDVYNQDHSPIWTRLYGQSNYGYGGPMISKGLFGIGVFNQGSQFGFGGGGCCYSGPGLPPERTMKDRLRNSVSMLPEAQTLSRVGEVSFVAWNQQPLGSITVDGVSPQRRDLNLIVAPLTVDFTGGPFTMRTGTFGAHLVDDVSLNTLSNTGCCCCTPSPDPVYVGSGDSATFAFDLPRAHRLHFSTLWLQVDAGGADGANIGSVYDWRARRWVHEDLSMGYAGLSNPDRFLSPAHTVLVKLAGDSASGDIRVSDPHQDLQLSGTGVAS